MKTKVKKLISGILSVTLFSTTLTHFPVIAEDTSKYPYTMFAGSSEEGAITINASNVCINGNIATNGTIVSSGNMNVNGSKTEIAAEEMLYFFKKLDYAYFSGSNVEAYTEDYSYENMNININNPLEVEGELELTGNINLNTGIKALEDVNLYGEVKNTNDSVICSETGDIIINTTNVNLNGLVYAPEGCVDITAQNLNMNNVIIIADTIKVECPNLNANYNSSMGEFIGTESEVELFLYAFGEYMPESNSIDIYWNTTVPKGTFDIQISYDNETFTSVGTVTDVESYSHAISEEFEKMYIKVAETTYYGEISETVPFVVTKSEDGYTADYLDSDEDNLPDIFEIEIGTRIDVSDSDEDGLTDYQEVYFTDTDPTIYDSVTEGIRDADIDSDSDGLSNFFELENEIDPLLEDTDEDDLSDYDEIYVYSTNPDIPDSDEDNVDDGAEIKLGLNPNNPETFGVPDAEYSIEQQIGADSTIMTEVNTEENAYELSLKLKTNGYAEDVISISKSGYSSSIDNEAMLGISTDIEIDNSCNTDNIVLKYTIKDEYLDNTLGMYADCEEFQGIKRLNVFKYFEELNMLLPIETQFDVDNNLVYAEVDELGTYCIMDMEVWLDSLGVKPVAEEQSIDLSDFELNYGNNVAILSSYSEIYEFNGNKYQVCDQRATWTNAQAGCENAGGHLLTIGSQEEQDFIMSILDEDCKPFYWLGGRKIDGNWQWVTKEPFVYSNFSDVKPENEFVGDCLRIYGRDMGGVAKGQWSDTVDYHALITSIYSEYYGGFICEWEGVPLDTPSDEETDKDEEDIENEDESFEALIGTKWKTIQLDGELNSTNGIDSDSDTLTDWQEVNTKLLKWNDDGSYELPTLMETLEYSDLLSILGAMIRWEGTPYEYPIGNIWNHKILPLLSDPTEEDSDGDEFADDIDPNCLLSDVKIHKLEHDEYLRIEREGQIYYGSAQSWFADLSDNKYFNSLIDTELVTSKGCGLIAAADTLAYLNIYKDLVFEEFAKELGCKTEITTTSGKHTTDILNHIEYDYKTDKIDYINYIDYICLLLKSEKLKFNKVGKNSAILGGYFPASISSMFNYVFEMCNLPYKATWSNNNSEKTLKERMIRMIDNNIPVIISYNSEYSGIGLKLYDCTTSNNYTHKVDETFHHYMVATSLIEYSDDAAKITGHSTMVKVSTWGKEKYIDLSEYNEYADVEIDEIGDIWARLYNNFASNILNIEVKNED